MDISKKLKAENDILISYNTVNRILRDVERIKRENKWIGEARNIDSNLIEELIDKRKEARKNKNFSEADNIRVKLNDMGIEIEDTLGGTTWRSKN